MRRLCASLLACIAVNACASGDLLLKQYGHPSDFASADDWMAHSYIKGAYVDGKPVYFTVTGLTNEVFTTREAALSRMRSAYGTDYREFFVACFDMDRKGQVCDYLK